MTCDKAGVNRPSRLPPVWLPVACFLFDAVELWPQMTTDFPAFLFPWFEHIRATGPVAAFAHPFSDYAPPYLYLLAAATLFAGWASALSLVKLLSIAGTAALAFAVRALLAAAGAPQPGRAAALVLLWPTVTLNALLLTQCDALYAAASVMMVAACVRGRPRAALGWFGLSVAIKAQGAFLGPFLLAWLLARRVPVRVWPLAPLVTLAAWAPAAAAGWPVSHLLTVYLRQTGSYPALALNAPNLAQILSMLPGTAALPLKGALLAAAVAGAAAFAAVFSRRLGSGEAVIALALLCVLLVVGLLPMMHERYFFVADVLALAQALVRRDRASWVTAWGVEAGSMLGLLGYLTGIVELVPVGAAVMILATARIARLLLGSADGARPRAAPLPLPA